jgi:hypothetical protein
MLPMMKTKAIAALTATALVISTAAPSYAWGQREQDVLKGVLATILIGTLITQANKKPKAQPVPQQQPQPIYVPAPISIYQTPVAARFNAYNDSRQRRIQSTLSAYGYYRGAIDGSFGPGTYNATVAYANATGKSGLLGTQAGANSIFTSLLF